MFCENGVMFVCVWCYDCVLFLGVVMNIFGIVFELSIWVLVCKLLFILLFGFYEVYEL